jgi:hypothetical protein
VSGSGPVTEALADDGAARRRVLLDAVAVAITRLGDLSRFDRGEVAQLHRMALELAAAANRALAEMDEPR